MTKPRWTYSVPGVWCLALSALGALGASVPQDTAEKYYFSRPNLPSNIVGKVMGSPPAYSVWRSEDVAWLREAWCERYALVMDKGWTGGPIRTREVPTYGRFPLAESNLFSHVTTAAFGSGEELVTNIVVGYTVVTNRGWAGVDRARAGSGTIAIYGNLDTHNTTLQNANDDPDGYLRRDGLSDRRVAIDMDGWPPVTNIVRTVTTNWPPYYADEHGNNNPNIATNVSTISMAMTNGTTSVWTNRWTYNPARVTVTTATNITFPSGIAIAYPEGRCGYAAEPPAPLQQGLIRASAITNYYTWLAGLNLAAYNNAWPLTNGLTRIKTEWKQYDEDPARETVTTNDGYMVTTYWTTFELFGSRTVYRDKYTESNETVNVTETVKRGHQTSDYAATCRLPTPYSMACVHTGGVDRIAQATLYCDVAARWARNANMSGNGDEFQSMSTSRTCRLFKKIGVATEAGADTNNLIAFACDVDVAAIAREALGEIATVPTGARWTPDLEWDAPEPDLGGSTSSSTWETYEAWILGFTLLFELRPWASLDGWNNQGEPSP